MTPLALDDFEHFRIADAAETLDEILFVDDGSTDSTGEVIERLHAEDARVRAIRFRRNYGKSAALSVAFREVRGDRVVTMDLHTPQIQGTQCATLLVELIQGALPP